MRETISGNRTADKIYDLQESTFWQAVDNTSYPHHIVIDLGKVYSIKVFECCLVLNQNSRSYKGYNILLRKENLGISF